MDDVATLATANFEHPHGAVWVIIGTKYFRQFLFAIIGKRSDYALPRNNHSARFQDLASTHTLLVRPLRPHRSSNFDISDQGPHALQHNIYTFRPALQE
jgi:hypothetical protein